MISFEAVNIQWLFFLLAAATFSVLGVLFPNWFKELGNPRPHNGLKLFNECLARHQFGYFTFFCALYLAASFDPKRTWIRNLNWFAIALSLGFYGYGLFSSARLDRKISKNHTCQKDTECEVAFPFRFRLRLSLLNIFFALVSLVGGVFLALLVKP